MSEIVRERSDWNDLVKQQREISLGEVIQSTQAQVIRNHPLPKRETVLEL